MEHYLTIGEFAQLRNVDRKSLRYYERIGALIPAYIDPHTKYRYYKMEQLVDLDTILICLELGIPLKEAAGYRQEDGTLDISKLFQDGQDKVNEKILRLHLTLRRLESSLRAMQDSKAFQEAQDFYRRNMGRRYVLRTPFHHFGQEISFRNQAKELFLQAQSRGLLPLFNFPVGLMVERQGETVQAFITLELLPYDIDHPDIVTLPEGTYLCRQLPSSNLYDPPSRFLDVFSTLSRVNWVAVSNLTLERYENGIFPLEVQALQADATTDESNL